MNNLIAQIDFEKMQDAIPGLKNQFKFTNNESALGKFGGIITSILPYIYVAGGFALFFFLVSGGLQMMTSASNEKGVTAAKNKITSALVGFILLFVSYWLVKIIEIIFGVNLI